ncbi:MAG: helix-turn-helix domain-containing protein, partial [Pseudomonadota bacterium]
MVADADIRSVDAKKSGERPARRRRPQERAEATKNKLLEAAVFEFADRGFDAVTIRDIEVRADVQRGLLSYHFGDKESLWKASVDKLFLGYREFQKARADIDKDLPDREVLSFRIRNYVRFSA